MARTLPEWFGATIDAPVPARVKLRLLDRQHMKCRHCGRAIVGRLCPPQADHIFAIINGGENRESNLKMLCRECHADKTAGDLEEKATVARVKSKHRGLGKHKSRPMPGTRASGIRKKMDGTVEKR